MAFLHSPSECLPGVYFRSRAMGRFFGCFMVGIQRHVIIGPVIYRSFRVSTITSLNYSYSLIGGDGIQMIVSRLLLSGSI